MFILNGVRRLFGYVKLKVSGGYYERFLNLCVRNNVGMWNISKPQEGSITLFVDKKNVDSAMEYGKKAGCTVEVVEKKGVPYDVKRYRHRKVFAVAIVLCAIVVRMSTQVIWSVEITGESKMDTQAALDYLETVGVYAGARIHSISTDQVENNMLIDNLNLLYCSLSKEGTRVFVHLRDRIDHDPLIAQNEPSNLIAEKAGQIIRMEVREGEKMVKEGEAVTKGQLLASGIADSDMVGFRYIHSFGEVYARTYYNETHKTAFLQQENTQTGRQKRTFDMMIFGIRINLSKMSSIPYAKYDKISNIESMRIFNRPLPVTVFWEDYFEIRQNSYIIDEETAKKTATEEARKTFLQKNPQVTVLDEVITYKSDTDGVTVNIEFQCEEDIAKEQKIVTSSDETVEEQK